MEGLAPRLDKEDKALPPAPKTTARALALDPADWPRADRDHRPMLLDLPPCARRVAHPPTKAKFSRPFDSPHCRQVAAAPPMRRASARCPTNRLRGAARPRGARL